MQMCLRKHYSHFPCLRNYISHWNSQILRRYYTNKLRNLYTFYAVITQIIYADFTQIIEAIHYADYRIRLRKYIYAITILSLRRLLKYRVSLCRNPEVYPMGNLLMEFIHPQYVLCFTAGNYPQTCGRMPVGRYPWPSGRTSVCPLAFIEQNGEQDMRGTHRQCFRAKKG